MRAAPDPPPLFSNAWAGAWCAELAASEAYRQAAASWEGALVLEMSADPALGVDASRAVRVDLWHGDCRGGRSVGTGDGGEDEAPFVIRGTPAHWRQVLLGGTDPLLALMSGRLTLARGSLGALLPYARAARELVGAARRVATRLPNGWEEG